MKHTPDSRSRAPESPAAGTPRNSHLPLVLAGVLFAGLAGCSSGSSGSGSSAPPGTQLDNPVTGLKVVVDSHQGGNASELRIVGVFWGRLVDIFDLGPLGDRTLLFEDYLISDDIQTDAADFQLDRNPVTEREVLTILHPYDNDPSSPFQEAFARIDPDQFVLEKSLNPTDTKLFTTVPRNSAMVVIFDDLLEDGGNPDDPGYPGTVTPDNVELLVGNPPVTPYELRVLPDPNHGDLIDGNFHSTRVILDFTLSKLEAQVLGLNINALGLPDAADKNKVNGVVRIPTRVNLSATQFEILTNLGGSGVAFNGNGPTDPFSPTLDVVRGFRSGGKTVVTGDPFNGFLEDPIPPQILGSQATFITNVNGPLGPDGDEFLVDITFQTVGCAMRPLAGDVLDLPNYLAEVTQISSAPVNGVVTAVPIKLLLGDPSTFGATAGEFKSPWNPLSGAIPDCFVQFSPDAGAAPDSLVPNDASIVVSFSEPMDPASVQAFDTFTIAYDPSILPPNSSPLTRNVVGQIAPSLDLREFSFTHDIPLRHTQGTAELYTINLIGGPKGVTDLAGNALVFDLPALDFTLDPSNATIDSLGYALRFTDVDEDLNGGPEVRGQILYDLPRGVVKPRPVQRFSAQVDPSVPIVGAMLPFTQALQTPLSNHGSKMMTVWRYCDLGFPLLDEFNHNLDVEGLWWAPFASGLQIDTFREFQIALSHSKFLPDEVLDPNLLPLYPSSGLVGTFEDNVLDRINDPLKAVHPKQNGYLVQPLDVEDSPTGMLLAPWPLNRNVPEEQVQRWTYRDTSLLAVGGPNGDGADPDQLTSVTAGFDAFYAKSAVPTIGLPMLMEFRTYPDTKAFGQNGFKVAIAINSSIRPYFRAFSTGGISTGGTVDIDPDQELIARGGINPVTGASTPALDPVVYYGQADFVVRVSRMHTIWLDTLSASQFAPPVIEPGPQNLPSETQLVTVYRGAASITSAAVKPWENADLMDAYGDSYSTKQIGDLGKTPPNGSFTVQFFNNPPNTTDKSWKSDIALLNGAQYVQARVTFLSNVDPAVGLAPEISALGIAYFK